ncbi:hypothetical protein H6G76_23275 [Nostoc sp. FACHB-152]|uniref:hypothetical protein n=1 Tax=unclassified Nostoc TaxID=2593658 RepID=UPI001683EC1C|nr:MULTISPECIES: hypothetical protein [unclassified Nostoc]MBD2450030.1 hypothetical protein [Nostoc sp. FACHB-152]MBD2470150.1 hypothetical protein [Nostoc sp. FACHB-145]
MKDIIKYIKNQENKFLQLKFFQVLTNSGIDPIQRLSLLPYLTDLAMSFQDLNHDLLNDGLNSHIGPETVNSYSVEDGSYWRGYLKYLETLEINQVMQSSDYLKFMGSNKTLKTRRLANSLIAKCRYENDILLKIVIIAAIDASGSPAIRAIAKISEELLSNTNEFNSDFSQESVKLETINRSLFFSQKLLKFILFLFRIIF